MGHSANDIKGILDHDALDDISSQTFKDTAFDVVDVVLPPDKWIVFKGSKWDSHEPTREAGTPFSWSWSSSIAVAKQPSWFDKKFEFFFPARRIKTPGIPDTSMDPVSKLIEMGFEIKAEQDLKATMKQALAEGADPTVVGQYLAKVVANMSVYLTIYLLGVSDINSLIALPQADLTITWEAKSRSHGRIVKFDSPSSWDVTSTWKDYRSLDVWYDAVNDGKVFTYSS